MNRELPDVQTGFKKDRGTRDQIGNSCWTIGKAREFQKNIYFCFIDYAKVFAVWIIENAREFQKNIYFCFIDCDCMDHNKLWKILKEMRIPDHLTYLLRNL